MVRPCATRSSGSRCGAGIDVADGSPPASASIAVCTVKSPGVIRSRSDHWSGKDTDVPGVAAGCRRRRPLRHPRGVDEDLAGTVLNDERRRRNVGVERFGTGGQRANRAGDVFDRGGIIDRHKYVNAFGAAGLYRARKAGVGQCTTHEVRDGDHCGEAAVGRRVQVEYQGVGR